MILELTKQDILALTNESKRMAESLLTDNLKKLRKELLSLEN